MMERLIIDGNSIYEIDDECIKEQKKKEEYERKKQEEKQKTPQK